MPKFNVDNPQPSATGQALQLVQAHSSTAPLKLYAGWFCPFVQRAWIVLEEKNLPYQYIEINPYDKSPEFLALNPRGLVPTLAVPVSGDKKDLRPLYESTVICEYLEEAYPDSGPRLLPQGDSYERARCRLWIDHVGSRIVPAWYKLMQHTDDKPYSIQEAREGLHKHLKAFAKEMLEHGSGGPWFLGDRFSLADVALVPWAQRLWLIDHYKPGGVGIPKNGERGEDEAVWGRWDTWLEAALERKSVRETASDEKEYIAIYKRYAEDTTQSEVGQATRQGGKLP
ncbi:glutathione S-transferase [Coniochaeta ligniaria NRRL 30616]|uniref:Glutathione S-transferase n=1 Tax=Coniochaeta ligniaria NRRL 30616 TaxID=1408157 RepID=A0A1J7IVJ9_9PEZI|nr:glutathione S-transferase [Coniochaeta ligniaria NRRL 30616]